MPSLRRDSPLDARGCRCPSLSAPSPNPPHRRFRLNRPLAGQGLHVCPPPPSPRIMSWPQCHLPSTAFHDPPLPRKAGRCSAPPSTGQPHSQKAGTPFPSARGRLAGRARLWFWHIRPGVRAPETWVERISRWHVTPLASCLGPSLPPGPPPPCMQEANKTLRPEMPRGEPRSSELRCVPAPSP